MFAGRPRLPGPRKPTGRGQSIRSVSYCRTTGCDTAPRHRQWVSWRWAVRTAGAGLLAPCSSAPRLAEENTTTSKLRSTRYAIDRLVLGCRGRAELGGLCGRARNGVQELQVLPGGDALRRDRVWRPALCRPAVRGHTGLLPNGPHPLRQRLGRLLPRAGFFPGDLAQGRDPTGWFHGLEALPGGLRPVLPVWWLPPARPGTAAIGRVAGPAPAGARASGRGIAGPAAGPGARDGADFVVAMALAVGSVSRS
jgi:hypothetical protein